MYNTFEACVALVVSGDSPALQLKTSNSTFFQRRQPRLAIDKLPVHGDSLKLSVSFNGKIPMSN